MHENVAFGMKLWRLVNAFHGGDLRQDLLEQSALVEQFERATGVSLCEHFGEFFADAFSAIASRQRPALVDMLSGDTRTALQVMLYFNRRYGI